MDKIRKIIFPDLLLDKQDKTSRDYPSYHWVELKSSKDNRQKTFDCFLIKSEDGYDYYMPFKQPYEIYREHNYPEEHIGSFVVTNDERDFKALVNLVPDNVVMPTLDLINSIPASRWVDIYCEIIKDHPDKINSFHNFSFFVTPDECYIDDDFYKTFCLVCYPFLGMTNERGIVKYSEGVWLGNCPNSSFHRRVADGIGNILTFNRKYYDEYSKIRGGIIPIIKNKKQ